MAEVTAEMLAAKFGAIFPHLDERQRRLMMGAEARVLGHGGIRMVARAAEVREATVSQGAAELDRGEDPLGRVRRVGGGRKRLADLDLGLRPALLALVEPDERGDPMSPLRWTTRSLRALSAELARQVGQPDRGWAAVAGAVVAGAFDAVGVMAGSFDDPWVSAVAAPGVEVAFPGDVGHDTGKDAFLPLRGERPPGQRPGGGRCGRSA